jgi:aryl-alcohol dehydrogenase-like predicted oxidoreductase
VIPTGRLGTTAMAITRVGFGAWAAGGDWKYGWAAQRDEDARAAILRALERGVNWIDTAPVYGLGHSERLVGRVLRELGERERPYVFTKCGLVWDPGGPRHQEPRADLSPASVRRECEDSLRRLGVERLDLLQVHVPDPATPVEETWATVRALVAEGKARAAGISNHDPEALERCRAAGPVDVVQPPLSLIERSALAGVLPWARKRGAGAIVYSPLHSGLLSGRFDRARLRALGAGDWRRSDPDFEEPRFSRNLALAQELRALAEERGHGAAELAIAWVLAQPGVTGAIVGARSAAQVDGWIGGATLALDAANRAAIERAVRNSGAGAGPMR